VQQGASKEHAEDPKQTNKSTRGPAGSSTAFRAPVNNTKQDQQVQQGASKEHVEDPKQTNKLTCGPAACRARMSNTKQDQQVQQGASKEHAEDPKQTNKFTRGPAACRAPNSNTKQCRQVGVNQQQQGHMTKASTSSPESSLWIRPNSKFNFGQPMLS
jgi:hypothetical protein